MTGDVSGGNKGEIKFHFTEFAQAPKIPGMKGGLAGAMLAEFEKILATFKNSLEGNAKEGRELARLATDLVSLAEALNAVTSTEESPSELVSQIDASIEAVKKDMAPFKKNAYYSVLISALTRIETLFQGGGVVAAVRRLNDDLEALAKWMEKHAHGKVSKEAKKKLEQLEGKIGGDITTFKEMQKNWPTNILGPFPSVLYNIGMVASSILSIIDMGNYNKSHLANFIRTVVKANKKAGRLSVTSTQVIRLLQAMARDDDEGKKLRKYLPGMWAAYDGALGAVREMQAQAASMSNTTVANIYSKMTAIQQLTKLLSKDLNVPITAIDQSITRVFR